MPQKFYYDVLMPFRAFDDRAQLNMCVPIHFSDLQSLGSAAAIAAYHHWEVVSRTIGRKNETPKMKNQRAEMLRERLGDICDTAKHGRLRKERREITFVTGLDYEYDKTKGFKFLRTFLRAKSQKWPDGFDVADTIAEYLDHVIDELGYNVAVDRSVSQSDFQNHAVTYFHPMPYIEVPNINIRFFIREEDGSMVPIDPPEVTFMVLDANGTQALAPK